MDEKLFTYSDLLPEDFLNRVGLDKPPQDLVEFARGIGIKIDDTFKTEYMIEGIEGKAFVENGQPTIWIDKFLPENRKRFTLAHEIGHVLRDILPALKNGEDVDEFPDDGATLSFNRDGKNNYCEYRANEFAARFLMPQSVIIEELRKILDQDPNDELTIVDIIGKMAERFYVSQQAMHIRLLRLKIL